MESRRSLAITVSQFSFKPKQVKRIGTSGITTHRWIKSQGLKWLKVKRKIDFKQLHSLGCRIFQSRKQIHAISRQKPQHDFNKQRNCVTLHSMHFLRAHHPYKPTFRIYAKLQESMLDMSSWSWPQLYVQSKPQARWGLMMTPASGICPMFTPCPLPPSFSNAATVSSQGLVMDKDSVPMPELKQTFAAVAFPLENSQSFLQNACRFSQTRKAWKCWFCLERYGSNDGKKLIFFGHFGMPHFFFNPCHPKAACSHMGLSDDRVPHQYVMSFIGTPSMRNSINV